MFLLTSVALAGSLLTIPTSKGDFVLHEAYHGSLHFTVGQESVWIDPWSKAPMADAAPANVVLITDIHPDHLDAAALKKVRGPGTALVVPKAVAEELGSSEGMQTLENGKTAEVGGMKITAIPMYNLVRGPEAGKLFHDKGRGNGYLIEVGGKRIYVAGDTECTPEMKALTQIDHAFIPMNLPYTMPPEEAAACVLSFKPAAVTPYHYAGSDLTVFAKALEGATDVKLVQIEAYPGGLPW